MKNLKIILVIASFISLSSCSITDDNIVATQHTSSNTSSTNTDSSDTETACGFHNGNQLYKGPEGGCYYYNSNGNKTYVDRSECNC